MNIKSNIKFGLVSGLVIICTSILSIELGVASVWLGFLVMFLVFSYIFVAVKQYRDVETMREQYANPLMRLPMTFIETFPVGLLVSLGSAFFFKDGDS